MNLTDIASHWVALHEALGLGAPIADEAQYERLLALVDELFDSTAADPTHPLGGLVALLGERIREYEARVHPWPDAATPAELVKQRYRDWERDCVCPPGIPLCVCDHRRRVRLVERGGVVPTEVEIAANPRARTARLRAAVKLVEA